MQRYKKEQTIRKRIEHKLRQAQKHKLSFTQPYVHKVTFSIEITSLLPLKQTKPAMSQLRIFTGYTLHVLTNLCLI